MEGDQREEQKKVEGVKILARGLIRAHKMSISISHLNAAIRLVQGKQCPLTATIAILVARVIEQKGTDVATAVVEIVKKHNGLTDQALAEINALVSQPARTSEQTIATVSQEQVLEDGKNSQKSRGTITEFLGLLERVGLARLMAKDDKELGQLFAQNKNVFRIAVVLLENYANNKRSLQPFPVARDLKRLCCLLLEAAKKSPGELRAFTTKVNALIIQKQSLGTILEELSKITHT